MRTVNMYSMLNQIDLYNLLATKEVTDTLELWHSGVLSHVQTVDRLGGYYNPSLSDKDYQHALGYLYNVFCA